MDILKFSLFMSNFPTQFHIPWACSMPFVKPHTIVCHNLAFSAHNNILRFLYILNTEAVARFSFCSSFLPICSLFLKGTEDKSQYSNWSMQSNYGWSLK